MYPERLLPSIEKISLFNGWEGQFLCRLTSGTENLWIEYESGKFELNDNYIKIDKTVNSCNFIDASRQIHCCTSVEDVFIYVKDKKYTHNLWDGRDESVPKSEEIEFEVLEGRGYYLLRIVDFHNFEGFYPFKKNTPDETERKYILKVKHSPNFVNICHFDLCAHVDGEEEPIDPNKRKPTWVKDILHLIRERIHEKAQKDLN